MLIRTQTLMLIPPQALKPSSPKPQASSSIPRLDILFDKGEI
jgi:hypothetical protein